MKTRPPIPVSEIFGPTIQGEGELIGTPTIFVRTGGCDYRCAWCDSMYAVDTKHRPEWREMPWVEIAREIRTLSGDLPILVTLSGGNPALRDFEPLIDFLQGKGYTFSVETQGSVAKPWFETLDYLTLSPKPPSAQTAPSFVKVLDGLTDCIEAFAPGFFDWPERHLRRRPSLKVPIFGEDDLLFARNIAAHFPAVPMFLSVGNPRPEIAAGPNSALLSTLTDDLLARLRAISEWVARERWFDVRVLPQQHVLTWGTERAR